MVDMAAKWFLQGTDGTHEADLANGFRIPDCIWFHNQGTCQGKRGPNLRIKMNHLKKRGGPKSPFWHILKNSIKMFYCSLSILLPSPGGTPRDALPEVGFLPRDICFHPSLHSELRLTHVGTIALELHGAEAHKLSEVVPWNTCSLLALFAFFPTHFYAFLFFSVSLLCFISLWS